MFEHQQVLLAIMPGFSEYIVLIGAVLMMFGARKVPEIARTVGRVIHDVRRASNEFRDQIMTADLNTDTPESHEDYDYDHEHDHEHDHDFDAEHADLDSETYDPDHDAHYTDSDSEGVADDSHAMEHTVSQGSVTDVADVVDAVAATDTSTHSLPVEAVDSDVPEAPADPQKTGGGE